MSKKRRKKKNSKGAIIVAVIIIIALIIGVAFMLSGGKDKPLAHEDTTTPEISTTLGDSKEDKPSVSETEGDTTLPEDSTESTTEKKEDATIPTAAPAQKVEADVSDMINEITAHYEDYMGVDKGVLFINESEAVQRNGKYEFILRSNGKTPNQYIADVYVNTKTGQVTDSIGSESWTVNLWY